MFTVTKPVLVVRKQGVTACNWTMAGAVVAEMVTLFADADGLHAEWRISGKPFLQV
jgi:hypothetical protein